MKTVIYLDELLLTNFLAAAALLLGAGLLCARQCSGLRLMAGSAAAAAASLGILLPELPEPAAFLYKVFTCCAAVAAAYGVPGLRNFVQLCAWYLLLNLLLCGAVLLPGVQSANLCVYLPLSPGRLLLCCGAVLAVLRGVLFCFGRAGHPLLCRCAGAGRCSPLRTGFLRHRLLSAGPADRAGSGSGRLSRRAQRPAAGAAHISGPLFCLRHSTAAGVAGAAGALHHHCRALRAACRSGQGPAHQQRQCSGHSGRILPPGNTAAMDSSAGQRIGRTAGHPLRST